MKNHEEHNMQVEVFRHARMKYPILETLMFAVPNARACSPRQGNWLKKEGVTAGVPDIVILVPRGLFHFMTIEMKLPKYESHRSSGLSDLQIKFMYECNKIGGHSIACHSTQEALDIIDWYMGL